MMRFVEKAEKDADVILFIVDVQDHKIPDFAFTELKRFHKPVILVVNKIDTVSQDEATQKAEQLQSKYKFAETVFTSALQNEGIEGLLNAIFQHLKPGPPFYPKDELSEHPVRFFASELIREQLFLQYHEEIPYSATVEVIQYQEREDLDYINAEVIVNRNSQKGMIIGKGGKAIKQLGMEARKSIEEFIGRKVFLDLHVKVRESGATTSKWFAIWDTGLKSVNSTKNTMIETVEEFLEDGCGRCQYFATPDCKVNSWRDELIALREILLKTELQEELKWSNPCYTYDGINILMLSALKNQAVVGFLKVCCLTILISFW